MRFLLVDNWSKHGARCTMGAHEVQYFNPRNFLDGDVYSSYLTAERIVNLHRSSNRSMHVMLKACSDALHQFGADGLVVHQNPFPPEWLVERTQGLVRVLGCFDDPQKAYTATIPVLWAFHGAYYCSPSYSAALTFSDALKRFGMPNSHWFALSNTIPDADLVDAVNASWKTRARQALYIGKCYGDKVDKLAQFDQGIGRQLVVHGQGWPLGGLAGFVAPLRGRRWFPKWVRPASEAERCSAYLQSLVGFNVHLGDGEETGNMRMYETTMHGALLLCDSAGCDAHSTIFKPDVEALFYRSIEEAIDKCLYCFEHPERAIAIAQKGFERCRRDYHPQFVLANLLNWAAQLRLGRGQTRS